MGALYRQLQGAYAGWQFGAVENISKTLPGLENFYMAGQMGQSGRRDARGRDVR